MKSKSGLFLTELMLCIFFFALGSAICLQMFVKAHVLSEKSRDLSFSIEAASTMIDYWKDCNGDYDILMEELLSGEYTDNIFTIYYSKDGRTCEEDEKYYTLYLTTTTNQSIQNAHITVENPDSTIFEIDSEHFVKEGS
jgi:hypothetical protein